jgi:hypothetical protein
MEVLGLLVPHYQVVAMYICDNWYVMYVFHYDVQHVLVVTYVHC